MHNEMTKMPLRNHKFEQKQNTERPQPVAPGFGSDLAVSLREVAPGSFSRLRVMKTRATSPCRSGMVALSFGSDFSTSLWKVAPRCKCVSPDVKTRATLCSRSE
ncbi:hypothetical protein IGI04_026420 [Brassica rapa subsp. trilocularis]|uniref:Uncharacterized protein n=1 Tax=Brassica rapa subsp. trilocularis TaxID=1813537 RepID=A0ABQ7KW10_BRACM|nr:hypothetical protein IGI04_026420 [Brassica rapa subsp. trilocularis]